jgi:hypothetical protein
LAEDFENCGFRVEAQKLISFAEDFENCAFRAEAQ